MKKKDELELYEDLELIFKKSENIYKLVNIIKKYCDSKPDSDDLYEVSYIIENILEKQTQISLDLYRVIHKNDEPLLIKNANSKIVGIL